MKTKITAALVSLGLILGFTGLAAAPASAASSYLVTTNSSYVSSSATALNGGRVTCNSASVGGKLITVRFYNSRGALVATVTPRTSATGTWQVYSTATAGYRYRVTVPGNGTCLTTITPFKTVAKSPFQPA